MRIAQVAPLYESVPPKTLRWNRTGRFYLTEELVRQGHEVTLFASGDSLTEARSGARYASNLCGWLRVRRPVGTSCSADRAGAGRERKLRLNPLPH